MINPQNDDITNDATVAGTDLFADSESFLVELNDSELVQINGGAASNLSAVGCDDDDGEGSSLSVLLC